MKEPIKIMLFGITIMIVSLFFQNLTKWESSPPSSLIQIVFAAGLITVIAGYFYKGEIKK
ncbi:hypothetical protein FZC78_11935 [Rossellomorea vietnamensis]|uniref:Uncharacterized protein n=1 Tax=Rossellomorea vietnamensis TaxID=218284 RepID=A0A5D4NSU3_9BACI|nr:hypothetical protein [Rossellomorea vietnamensis]TYS16691.1 hypothetical protein FZC78_11935 [Rossellomorea vietnamensis]